MNMKSKVAFILFFNAFLIAQNVYYVAPTGSDDNPGTLEKPFATIEKAKAAVRADLPNAQGDITVYLRGGMYQLKQAVIFEPADGGGDGRRVIYRNYEGEEPMLSSGVKVDVWKKPDIKPDGMPDAAFGNVYVADMPQGIEKFYCLYDGIYRLPRARGNGFTPTQGANDPNRSTTQLHYPADAGLKNWRNITDVEIFIRPWCLWSMNILPLAKVDEKKQIAYTSLAGSYPLTRERYERFGPESVWVENIPEALDQPGEWVVNTKTRKIYLWPLRDIADCDIYVPALCELVAVMGDEQNKIPVRNIVFDGLTFVHSERDVWIAKDAGLQHDWEMYDKANAMLRFRWAQDCRVENCGFIGGGSGGLRLDLYAQNITVENCEIARLGSTGLLLCGYGPGKKDVNKNNLILNNHIHHIGELYWQSPAVMVWQSGSNRIANNYIHHTPYNSVAFGGVSLMTFQKGMQGRFGNRELERTIITSDCRELFTHDKKLTWPQVLPYLHSRDNVFEYNEVHHSIQKLGDGNAVYLRMCPEGNKIRRNYFHDIYGSPDTVTAVLRADDAQAGCEFVDNIIQDCVAGGIDSKAGNLISNNIIVDIFTQNDPRNVNKVKPKGYINSAPSSVGYDNTDYVWHDKTVVTHNVYYSTAKSQPVFYAELDKSWPKEYSDKMSAIYKAPQVDNNVVYWTNDKAGGYVSDLLARMRTERDDEFNSVAADPMFIDMKNGDFRFKPDSPCHKLGIKGLNSKDMGLVKPLDGRFARYEQAAAEMPVYERTETEKTRENKPVQKGFGHD